MSFSTISGGGVSGERLRELIRDLTKDLEGLSAAVTGVADKVPAPTVRENPLGEGPRGEAPQEDYGVSVEELKELCPPKARLKPVGAEEGEGAKGLGELLKVTHQLETLDWYKNPQKAENLLITISDLCWELMACSQLRTLKSEGAKDGQTK